MPEPSHAPVKILVTGFEPFCDTVNISQEVVKRLRANYPNVSLVTLVLPTEYQPAETLLRNAIATEKPDLVLSLGEINYEDEPGIKIELRAHSRSTSRDTANEAPECRSPAENEYIRCSHPRLNAVLAARFRQQFDQLYPVAFSTNAGSFLCNDIYYTGLKAQLREGNPGQVMFVHLNDLAAPPFETKSIDPKTGITRYTHRPELQKKYDTGREYMIARYAETIGGLLTYIGANPQSIHYKQGYAMGPLPKPAEDNPMLAVKSQKDSWHAPMPAPELYPLALPYTATEEVNVPFLPGNSTPKQRQ